MSSDDDKDDRGGLTIHLGITQMCGIVGAVAQRDITEILLEGLRRLEYRGYDSAGLAVVNNAGHLQCIRKKGKVDILANAVRKQLLYGNTGVAHTRWATHGEPTEVNAHPHISDHIVVVHNGIIENHETLRKLLQKRGYIFVSNTDTEVIAHLVHWEQHNQRKSNRRRSLADIIRKVIAQLHGVYAIAVMDSNNPSVLIAALLGSPLVIGCGTGENFLASDQLALLPVTRRFIFLKEGDIAEISFCTVTVRNKHGRKAIRPEMTCPVKYDDGNKGKYPHYMKKEIFEQPKAIQNTLEGRFHRNEVVLEELGENVNILLSKVRHIQIIACGTSYHAAMVSRYWFESLAGMPCDMEIASEFRYRKSVVRPGSLLIAISQSGETADTLGALRLTKSIGYLGSLAICNVVSSSLVRESDFFLMTRAGTEISVASTKTFTTQLTLLLMFVTYLGRRNGIINKTIEAEILHALQSLPTYIEQVLSLDKTIEILAKTLSDQHHVLFLGRGDLHPIAMEGALKLKEISYIHAEAYAIGEMKHGPLALIDSNIPVIIIAPNNDLLEKSKSNIEEILSRGGQLYIFTDKEAGFIEKKNMKTILIPHVEHIIAPIFYTIPMQLLAYHIAFIKGTDVDLPRNLAKSVTVE